MTQLAPLVAAWFVNPALLGGLGLAALPILIHLLSRRQFRRLAWGATRFLLEAEKENRRRVRFEQWLLVALRCLAVALLALLVARPFVQPGLVASLLGRRGQVQRVVLIDDSASLAFRTGNTQDFALLRDAAERLLRWLHDGAAGDHVGVYLSSQPGEALVGGQRLTAATVEDLQARVRRLEPVNLSARPRRVLQTNAGDLGAAGKGAPADLYVLSDFQRSEWLALDSSGASVFEPLSRLDPDALRVVLIATGTAARDNVAILDAQLERPQTVAGQPAVVNMTVANYSGEPLDNAQVRVEVDGAPLPPVPVKAIAAGESRTVAVEVTFPDDGFAELAVRVDTIDGLPADNARRLALPVKGSLAVLLVDGQPATDPVRDEVYFLRNALAPTGPFSSGIRVQTTDPVELEATALDAFDCVMLCNVAALGQGAVAALQRYVRKGGGLVFFLGDQVGDPDKYNRVFYVGGDGLLPLPLAPLHRRDNTGEGVRLVRTGDHPVTAMFPASG
ncbi:MAG: BatA domain-containing protein, partial [Phycisphaerae bacterium]